MCEPVSNYGGQRQCGYCQLMMGNGPIVTMDGRAGLMKNSFTSHTIDNCNASKVMQSAMFGIEQLNHHI